MKQLIFTIFITTILLINNIGCMQSQNDDKEIKFVIANCLLRDGKIRHFRLSNITARAELKDNFKDIIGYGIKTNDN